LWESPIHLLSLWLPPSGGFICSLCGFRLQAEDQALSRLRPAGCKCVQREGGACRAEAPLRVQREGGRIVESFFVAPGAAVLYFTADNTI
jgi:hypothetical protein